MRITELKGYVFYATPDRSRVESIMEGDNESRGRARDDGLEQIAEVDYWLIMLKQERERKDRKRVEDAMRAAKFDGSAVVN